MCIRVVFVDIHIYIYIYIYDNTESACVPDKVNACVCDLSVVEWVHIGVSL